MARRDYTSEQIIHKFREAAVLLAQFWMNTVGSVWRLCWDAG